MSDEEKSLAPDTPADTLHAHVENHIALPDASKFENEPLMNEVTSHPNLASHSIEKMYHHIMSGSSPKLAQEGHAEPYSNEWAENLLKHPNSPSKLKQDFVQKTFHPDNPSSSLHQELADSGAIGDDQLRSMADTVLQQGETPHAYKQLPPSYYMNQYKKGRSNPDHDKASDLESFGREGLISSTKHTPDSLNATVDAATGDSRFLHRLVDERDDLTKEHLNKIHQLSGSAPSDDYYAGETIDKVLSHKNVDPSLLAKYAVGKDVRESALENPKLPKESIDAIIKRVKSPNDYDDRRQVQALLNNPSITPAQVKALAAKGSTDAIQHDRADEADVRSSWASSPKDLESARNILQAKKTPPDVLKELVNHKNQDVAIQALEHPNADADVVNEGLARKAKKVQDAARKHPLVKDRQISEGLKSGSTSLVNAYNDDDYREHFDRMPKAEQEAVFKTAHDKYNGEDIDAIAKKTKERPENVVYSKYQLAADPRVPEPIREKHSTDLAAMFDDKIGKNKDIRTSSDNILGEHSDESHRIINAVSNLAEKGDKKAQRSILKNPAILQNLSHHVDTENAPGDFLEAALRKGQEYSRAATTVYDRHGSPNSFDSDSSLLTTIFRSKNLPEHVFDEVASNPDMMEKIGEGNHFDRYNDLPEPEQVLKYNKVLASGSHEAAMSVLQSNPPAQSFDKALNMLDPVQKNSILADNIGHVKNIRPDVFHNAVLGTYNDGDDFKSQAKAMEQLSVKPQDQSSLKQMMSIPEGSPGHVRDVDVMSEVPSEAYSHDYSIIDHALSAGRPSLAFSMWGRKLAGETSDIKIPSHRSSDQDKLDMKGSAEAKLADISAKVQSIPVEDTDNPVAANWENLINNIKERYGDAPDFMGRLKDAGANLDFLAEMPGTAGADLRKLALSQNLVSADKIVDISARGSLSDVLSIGSPQKKQLALQAFIQKPGKTRPELEELANRINRNQLDPEVIQSGRRQSLSDEGYGEYQNRLNSLIDVYQASAPDLMSKAMSNALKSHVKNSDLTNSDKDSLSDGIMAHVSNKAYTSPSDKNQSLYQTYKALELNGMAPFRMQQKLENAVFESKDYKTMVQMAQERHLTDAGLSKLSKVMAQPGMLTSQQISGLSTQFSTNTEASTVVNMTKAFEAKISQEGPGTAQDASKVQFMDNMSKTFQTSPETEEDKVKNDFVVNYLKKSAVDPNPAVSGQANNKLLTASIKMARQDVDQAVNLMSSLPDSIDAFATPHVAGIVPEVMANHPRFVEMSTSGWRLQLFAANAENLTGANANILVDRAMSEHGANIDKMNLFMDLENNEFVAPDDSVKVARSLSNDQFNKFAQDLGKHNSMEGNLIIGAKARLADLEAAMRDPNLVAAGAPYMGDEHRTHIMSSMTAMSEVVKASKMMENVPNLKDKLESVSGIIDGIHKHVSVVTKALQDQCAKGQYNLQVSGTQRAILNVAQNISDTGLKLDREDALKSFEMINQFHSINTAAGLADDGTSSFKLVKSLVSKLENFEDQDWRALFAGVPHSVFHLKERASIPSEALASIDYKFFEDHPPREGQESVQNAFMKSSSTWFGKMSQEDAKTHGKNLLGIYVRMQDKKSVDYTNYQASLVNAFKYIGKHLTPKDIQDVLSSTQDHSVRDSLYSHAVETGTGGPETLHSYLRDYEKKFKTSFFPNVKDYPRGEGSNVAMKLGPVLKSPYIDADMSSKVCDMFDQNPEIMQDSIDGLMDNKSVHESAIKRLSNDVLDNSDSGFKKYSERTSINMAKKLMSHPNIPEKELLRMFEISNDDYPKYFESEGKFNPALANPTHGGKLFRSMPIVVPKEVPHVDESKVVKNVNLQHKDYDRMKEVMALIPAEGMSWAEFKRKYPKQEKSLPNSVKDVFMSAQNRPILPEAFATAMRSLDDAGKKYHLTYSKWSSDQQRHRGADQKPNLVVQINNSAESEKQLSQDPKLWSLYQKLLQTTNGINKDGSVGTHPTTPHLVSWSRVDTDQGGNAWVIEEAQSDFAQKFRRNLKSLIDQFPSGTQIDGQAVTAEDMARYSKVIDKHLDDWSEASMQAVIENAKAHGIKKLFMHGAELRGEMSSSKYTREFWDNRNTAPQTVGFRKLYDENPRKHGFQECDYTDYPKYSTKQLQDLSKAKLSSKCWVLDLAPDERPKRKVKKPNLE